MKKAVVLSLLLIPSLCAANFIRIAPPLDKITENFQATESDKNAGAVVLYRNIHTTVDAEGKTKGQVYMAIKLLDKKTVNDYSQFEIGYDSYYENINLDFARIVTPNGLEQNIEKDAQQIQSSGEDQFYDNSKLLKFSLPSLSPGTVIEYQYSFNSVRPVIANAWTKIHHFHYIQHIPNINWARIDPVRFSRFHVELPEKMQLNIATHRSEKKTKYSKSAYGHTYTWEETELPAIKIENNMPNLFDTLPYIEVSTLKEWRDIDRWVTNFIQPALLDTPAIKEKAAFLDNDKFTLEEKVKAVFNFVQTNIRYVYAHVNTNGFTPHKPSEVLQNNYGDCKDQTVLIVALLKAMGIEAYPALIKSSNGAPVNPDLPIMTFDHMIVHIPALKNHQWLDTSGDTGMFPGIYFDEHYALVLDGNGGRLLQLPISDFKKNKVLYTANFKEIKKGGVGLDVSLKFSGYFDTYFRYWYKHSQNKENDLHQLLKSFYDKFFTIESSYISNEEDLSLPFTIRAKLVFSENYEQGAFTFASNANALLNNFTEITRLPTPKNRVYAYEAGIVYHLSSITKFTPPDDSYKPYILKIGVDYDTPAFSLIHKSIKETNSIAIHMDFNFKEKRIEIDDYASFYQSINNAIKESESVVVYEKSKNNE